MKLLILLALIPVAVGQQADKGWVICGGVIVNTNADYIEVGQQTKKPSVHELKCFENEQQEGVIWCNGKEYHPFPAEPPNQSIKPAKPDCCGPMQFSPAASTQTVPDGLGHSCGAYPCDPPADVPAIYAPEGQWGVRMCAEGEIVPPGLGSCTEPTYTCADKSRILLTAEDGKRWCHKVQP